MEKFSAQRYDFDGAVREFEQNICLADYFACVVSELELQRIVATFKTGATNVPTGDREQARKIADKLLGVFRSRSEGYVTDLIQQLSAFRRGLLLLSDIYRYFEGDPNGFSEFAIDAVVVRKPKEDDLQLVVVIPLLESILTLLDNLRKPAVSDKKTTAAREAEFGNILKSVASQGLSFEKLKNLASILGFQGGHPGRHLEDYSAEHELRLSRKKWREVAEYRLQNDAKTRDEFGGRAFKDLSISEQSLLMHRVRIGVNAFEKRTDRSMAQSNLPASGSLGQTGKPT